MFRRTYYFIMMKFEILFYANEEEEQGSETVVLQKGC